MKTLFRHFLLLGVLLGLLWQGVAYASPPCRDMHQEQSTAATAMAGMADCMEAEAQLRDKIPPCKDMKAGCFAMVGCASLVALDVPPVAVSASTKVALLISWASGAVLIGRNEAPIPDPPSFPG